MPHTGIVDARDAASTVIDIGLVWLSTSASGQSRSMSADLQERGDRSQRLEQTTRTDRVADALVDAVLHRDVVVESDRRKPATSIVLMTTSIPDSNCVRSVEDSTVHAFPDSAIK